MTAFFLEILIFFPLQHEEEGGEHHRHHFRHTDGPPDAVDAPNSGEDQHRCHLEYQRPQEGNDCRGNTVAEGGEKPEEKMA